jgi:hypothetical protein
MPWSRLSQHFFCYPKFDYTQIGRVHFSHRQSQLFYVPLAFLVGCKGGGEVNALEVQAQVNNMDWRVRATVYIYTLCYDCCSCFILVGSLRLLGGYCRAIVMRT